MRPVSVGQALHNRVMYQSVLRDIQENHALAAGEKAIVAVSGGSDSVALLHIMLALQNQIGIDLHVASLNHGLRGVDGRADLEFVRELAGRWSLPFSLGEADVKSLAAEWGLGIEEAARRARYDFLAGVAREQDGSAVVVGHHALDQAETILLHIIRGSGLRGLQGMRSVAAVPGHREIRLIRPLLRVTREQILSYCRERDLVFRHDKSNDDIAYARNYLRHEVIERLRRLNPKAEDALIRLAKSAAVDDDFISDSFAAIVLPKVRQSPDRWRLSKETFRALHPALRRRLLQAACATLGDQFTGLDFRATVAAIEWALTANTGARWQLVNQVRLRVSYDHLFIERTQAAPEAGPYRLIPTDTDLALSARVPLACFGLSIDIDASKAPNRADVRLALPADVELRLRTRRSGERFKPKGMGGRSRKLKNWMIDRKIPREIRDQIPLICADGIVVAICLADTWHLADLDQLEPGDAASQTLWLR